MAKIPEDSSAFAETPQVLITGLRGDREPLRELLNDQASRGHQKDMEKTVEITQTDHENEGKICRICLHGDNETDPLIEPCQCTGTMQFVHETCLLQWLNTSYKGRCEVCFYHFKTKRDKKGLIKWRALPMTASQRTKYGLTIILHSLVLMFFLWSSTFVISEFMHADKGSTGYWIKLAIILISTTAFLCFAAHQSTWYVRLYERFSVYNMPITKVFGKAEDVSRFSRRFDLTMTDGMMSWTSAVENV